MKPANHGPIYVAMYPELAEIARAHGYALAIHGSLARDFDLICIPWSEAPSTPDDVVADMGRHFAFSPQGPEKKNHGRIAYAISVSFGECFIDLSFMPRHTEQFTNNICVLNSSEIPKSCPGAPNGGAA